MTKGDRVWLAEFTPITYESEFGVISLHSTRDGAKEAVRKHKKKEFNKNGKAESWVKWRVRHKLIAD